MCAPKLPPNSSRTPAGALLDGHRQDPPVRCARRATSAPYSSSTSRPGRLRVDAVGDGELERVVDDELGVGDPSELVGSGGAVDAEQVLVERCAMVEGECVQLPVVAEAHSGRSSSSEARTWSAPAARSVSTP